ncbi:hypothetical protein DIPPA_12377 [Diplonema papillatum]|nr:hypothetical protein DIPPA_12377 [Diplonema papillatum]
MTFGVEVSGKNARMKLEDNEDGCRLVPTAAVVPNVVCIPHAFAPAAKQKDGGSRPSSMLLIIAIFALLVALIVGIGSACWISRRRSKSPYNCFDADLISAEDVEKHKMYDNSPQKVVDNPTFTRPM